MRKSISFVYGHCMGDSRSRIQYQPSCSARWIQREDSLNSNVEGRYIKCFKHDLSHPFSVSLWVLGQLSEQAWVIFRSDSQLTVESMVPNLHHVLPVGDYAVRDWFFDIEDSFLGLGLMANIGFLLVHAYHDGGQFGLANNWGKLNPRSILSWEPSLAATWPIIDDDRNFIGHPRVTNSKDYIKYQTQPYSRVDICTHSSHTIIAIKLFICFGWDNPHINIDQCLRLRKKNQRLMQWVWNN